MVEDTSPPCPAELGKGLLAFIRVLAANTVLWLFLGRWHGEAQGGVWRTGCHRAATELVWGFTCKRKGGSLAGGCLWLACLLLKVAGAWEKCMFALGHFCGGREERDVDILLHPGSRGGSFSPQNGSPETRAEADWGVSGRSQQCFCRDTNGATQPWVDQSVLLWVLGTALFRQGPLACGSTACAACSQRRSWGCVLGALCTLGPGPGQCSCPPRHALQNHSSAHFLFKRDRASQKTRDGWNLFTGKVSCYSSKCFTVAFPLH